MNLILFLIHSQFIDRIYYRQQKYLSTSDNTFEFFSGLIVNFYHIMLVISSIKPKDHGLTNIYFIGSHSNSLLHHIPMNAVQVFTDGNKNDNNCTGCGMYVKLHKQEIKI